ncbi:MAG: hypothetical protein E7638_08750 [Ruminococcaceae bacterium]|nr:hypothetical protein [Oscillospiraceae bacterium]
MEGLKSKVEQISVFLAGGVIYSMIEILWRGFTHWTMTVVGGVCFLLLYRLNKGMGGKPLWLRCLLGAGLITAVEFAAGVVVNLIFRLDVWDYSGMPFNILGQVCPAFAFMWLLLCVPAFLLCRLIGRFFAGIETESAESEEHRESA